MGLFSEKKPYTAISSDTESLLLRGPSSDPAKLLNLIELIQGSVPKEAGPHEAGRLLRKKIKHGTPSDQLRALSLLETLVDNGVRTGSLVIESGLSEQLTQLAASHVGHSKADMSKAARATRQCRTLLMDWSTRKDRNIASLWASAGLVDKSEKRRNRVSFHPDDDLDFEVFRGNDSSNGEGSSDHRNLRHDSSHQSSSNEPPSHHVHSLSLNGSSRRSPGSPSTPRYPRSNSGNRSSRGMPRSRSPSRSPSPINLRGASLATTIATGHNIATRLTNSLIANPNGSKETETYYRQAKQLRHRIVKLVHDPNEEVQSYIGQLLAANEELIASLQAHDAVIKNHEDLEARDDHVNADLLGLNTAPVVQPVRPPPPVEADTASLPADSSPEPERPSRPSPPSRKPVDEFDPFADDNEQLERPKHTPMW